MENSGGDEYDFKYKIIITGETEGGKSHLVQRYIKNTLPKNPTPTIGVQFATRIITLKSGGTNRTQIWDTSGQERYRAIVSAHYRCAVGALLVYDVTDSESFSNVKRWIDELKGKADPDIVIMLVGNKVDLLEDSPERRMVPVEQAQELSRDEGILWIETSAITGANVNNAFEILFEEISKKYYYKQQQRE